MLPGGGVAENSLYSGSRPKIEAMRPSGGAFGGGGSPRCASTMGPHGQPDAVIMVAMAPASRRGRSASAASSSRSAKAARGSRAAMSSAPFGMGSDSCAASPRGVGRQKRAGRTKANSSMTSRQASISVPARASLHRRWQMTGTEARSRNAASPRSMLSISPAPEIQISRVPAG